MQSFVLVPASTKLQDSLTPLLNNDRSALSNSSGTVFPTTNLEVGMFCFRSDLVKLYELVSTSPSVWTLALDLNKAAVETDGSGNAAISGTFTAGALAAATLVLTSTAAFQVPVTVKTTGYTLTSADSNGYFSNQGAAGSVGFALPAGSAVGKKYTVYVHDAQTVSVIANTGQTIRNGTEFTAAAGNIASNVVGSLVSVFGVSSTEWIVEHITGAWTVT
jgi:hypothetical protein